MRQHVLDPSIQPFVNEFDNPVFAGTSRVGVEPYFAALYAAETTQQGFRSLGRLSVSYNSAYSAYSQGAIFYPRVNPRPVLRGTPVSMGFRIKGPVGRVINVAERRENVGGGHIGESAVAFNHTCTGGWDLVKIENYAHTTDGTGIHVGIQFRTATVAVATDVFYVDEVQIHHGATKLPDFVHPTAPGWGFTGAVNSSRSAGYPYMLENLAGRPAAWYDARFPLGKGAVAPADGTAMDRWVDLSGNGRDLTQSTVSQRPRFRSANPNVLSYDLSTGRSGWLPQQDPGSTVTVTHNDTNTRPGGPATVVKAVCSGSLPYEGLKSATNLDVPAGTWSISAWVHVSVSVPSLRIQIHSFSGGATVTTNTGPIAANTWTRIGVTGTTTTSRTDVGIWLDTGNTNKGALTLTASEVMLERGNQSSNALVPVTLTGGLPAVHFPRYAGDQRLYNDNTWSLGAATFYVVAKAAYLPTATPWSYLLDSGPQGGTRPYLAMQGISAPSWGAATQLSMRIDGSTGAATSGYNSNPHIISMTHSGTTGLTVGNRYTTNEAWNGEVQAVLCYEGVHNDATRKRVEQWLGNLYGISVAP